MSELTDHIRASIPRDLFFEREIKLLEPQATDASRRNRLKREVAKGNLLRLMRGVYALPPKYQHHGLHPFTIANTLAWPSHVSLESALSHYQLIPEAVYTTTSVTPSRSRLVSTKLGDFSFARLPLRVFRQGVLRHVEGPHTFLIANPLRALLDYVLLRKKDYTTLAAVESDLRIDLAVYREQMRAFANREIVDYKEVYNNARTSQVIDLILWELL